jgi:hypothetical protein
MADEKLGGLLNREKQIPPLRCGMMSKRTGNDKSKSEMQQQIPLGDDNKKSNGKNKSSDSSPFDSAEDQNDNFWDRAYWSRRSLSVDEELSVAHDLFFAVGVA